jgi:hypothetical protein
MGYLAAQERFFQEKQRAASGLKRQGWGCGISSLQLLAQKRV